MPEKEKWYGCYAKLTMQGNSRVFIVTKETTKQDIENEVIWELKFRRKTILSKDIQDAILVSQAESALVSSKTKQNLAYQLVCTRNNIPENFYPDVIVKNLEKHNKLIQLFRTPYIVEKEKYEQYMITQNQDVINPITEQTLIDEVKFRTKQVNDYKTSSVFQNKKDDLIEAVKQLDEYVVKKNLWIWDKLKKDFKERVKELSVNSIDIELALYDLAHNVTLCFVQDRVREITNIMGTTTYYENKNRKRRENRSTERI